MKTKLTLDAGSFTGSKTADAYLLEAAMQLRPEEVTTLEDLQKWMTDSAPAIATKARELQDVMFCQLQKPGVLKAVTRIIGAKVWAAANKAEIDRKVQMEINAALA